MSANEMEKISCAEATADSSVPVVAGKKEGRGSAFEWALLTVLASIAIGVYESMAQAYAPGLSIVKALHLAGYLKGYPVVFEPSKGVWHLIGWTGSAMMAVMMLYSVRKRFDFMSRLGSMRHWLSAHMFLGILGPVLVTFHTTFKLHGIIATSFWCMIVTMVFGILGRYIYVQIPRSITGAELGVREMDSLVEDLNIELHRYFSKANFSHLLGAISTADAEAGHLSPVKALFFMMRNDIKNRFRIYRLGGALKRRYGLSRDARREIVTLLRRKAALIRRKNFLTTSHRLLHYWHVLHVPLAIVMFLIMFLHIIVYYVFRPAV